MARARRRRNVAPVTPTYGNINRAAAAGATFFRTALRTEPIATPIADEAFQATPIANIPERFQPAEVFTLGTEPPALTINQLQEAINRAQNHRMDALAELIMNTTVPQAPEPTTFERFREAVIAARTNNRGDVEARMDHDSFRALIESTPTEYRYLYPEFMGAEILGVPIHIDASLPTNSPPMFMRMDVFLQPPPVERIRWVHNAVPEQYVEWVETREPTPAASPVEDLDIRLKAVQCTVVVGLDSLDRKFSCCG